MGMSNIRVLAAFALLAAVACGSTTGNAVDAALQRGNYSQALSAYERGKERDVSLLVRIASVLLEREILGAESKIREVAAT